MFRRIASDHIVEARGHFPRYFAVREGKAKARYLLTKRVVVCPRGEIDSMSADGLWELHEEAVERTRDLSAEVNNNGTGDMEERGNNEAGGVGGAEVHSLFDIKIELAKRVFGNCCFCERRCGIDRRKKAGWCGVKEPRLSSEFLHMGEEPELIPSHTFFFSGCTFGCVFCQNHDISRNPQSGRRVTPRRVAELIEARSGKSSNVNWVGGDPTPNLYFILRVLRFSEENTAQVWNSNMYLTEESMALLDGVIDLYLTDFKYGNDECALRLSDAGRYWDVVRRNHREANRQAEMIVRHLVMPNHLECCTEPIMEFLANETDTSCLRVNVMGQYRPEYKAEEHDDINNFPTRPEILKAKGIARGLGLSLCR